MSRADLRKAAEISPNAMTKMRGDEPVHLNILAWIGKGRDCNFGNTVDYFKEEASDEKI